MTTRNMYVLGTLGIFLTLTFSGHLSDAQSTYKFKVHVDVNTDDQTTKSLLQSWLKRELRSLGDVSIVSKDKAQFILTIIAIELESSGQKTGSIAVSTTFLQESFTTPGLYFLPYLQLNTDATKNLEGLCKRVVAAGDTNVLEPIREVFSD